MSAFVHDWIYSVMHVVFDSKCVLGGITSIMALDDH